MANVLIVSRTQMANGVCVGGINEGNLELIRLHNERGGNLTTDCPYQIGERWIMNVKDAWNARKRPHTEDKETSPLRKINDIGFSGIISFIKSNNFGQRLTSGRLEDTFMGYLNFDGNKNYINSQNVPDFSTQFWIPDRDLIHVCSFGKDYYKYRDKRIKFVGFQDPIDLIPAGTIIRLSLANWWDGDGSGESRCYLQLSGWYL